MADANITILSGQGGGVGPARSVPAGVIEYHVDIAAGATYATGGNPVPLTAEGLYGKLVGIKLLRYNDGVRYWDWDGSRTAPKLVARDAFQTEEGNGTDTSTVTLPAVIYMRV